MYKSKRWRFPNAIEVMEYHNARYGAPGMGRTKRKKPTREEMDKINQYNKERRCRHKLRQHFGVNDYFVTLTYRREARPPDMETAKQHFIKMMRKIRTEYHKRGCEVKWIRNIEVGSKGGWHIHMVINRIPDADILLRNAWPHGKAVLQLLYEKGEFADLASYITKTPKTDKRLRETSYSSSKNLPIPEPEEKVHPWKTWGKVRVPKGFYLESCHEGENPVTHHPYRMYTLIRIDRKTPERGRNTHSPTENGQKQKTVHGKCPPQKERTSK